MESRPMVDLAKFNNVSFNRGAPAAKEVLWRILQQTVLGCEWIKAYAFKRFLLRSFGATIESGVVIKPKARITFPWKLSIGSNSWIGEEVWMLNLDHVTIGSNVCISQRAFLCTGSHDWSVETFDLITKPITVKDGVWICAGVFIGPGVTIGENTVVTAGSVVTKDLPPGMICSGNPCVAVKKRRCGRNEAEAGMAAEHPIAQP